MYLLHTASKGETLTWVQQMRYQLISFSKGWKTGSWQWKYIIL